MREVRALGGQSFYAGVAACFAGEHIAEARPGGVDPFALQQLGLGGQQGLGSLLVVEACPHSCQAARTTITS